MSKKPITPGPQLEGSKCHICKEPLLQGIQHHCMPAMSSAAGDPQLAKIIELLTKIEGHLAKGKR
jgi:hypothetical protein